MALDYDTEYYDVHDHQKLFEFVWLPTFERTAKGLMSEEDKRAIERTLCERLDAGPVMRRTGSESSRVSSPGRTVGDVEAEEGQRCWCPPHSGHA